MAATDRFIVNTGLDLLEHEAATQDVGFKRTILYLFTGANYERVSDSAPLPVEVVSGGSAGVQYTEGDIDASVTGTAIMWRDAGDVMQPVDAGTPLPVAIITGGSGGSQFDDGDAIDTDSQGNLLIATTAIPGTARALRCNAGGQLDINDGGNSITVDDGGSTLTVDGTVAVTQSTSPWVIGDGGSSISIDDGGNVITVDGEVSNTELPAAALLADDMSIPTTTMVGAVQLAHDGSTSDNIDLVRHRWLQVRAGLTTGSGAGSALDIHNCTMSNFAVQIHKTAGVVSAYNLALEGSLDNTIWITMQAITSATGADNIIWVPAKPVNFVRSLVNSITGAGGTITITILATPR